MDAEALFAQLPRTTVVTDADVIARYGRDVTGRYERSPSAVLRPRTTDELATALRICNDHRVGVVPQGGNTGLVGGQVPLRDEAVLSLERLSDVSDVDRGSGTIVAGAGATLEQVQIAARARGMDFPIDFAARSAATVGGMVATNAGGSLVVRYGAMRDQIVGLRVVLADGTSIDHLDRPTKDSSGFDVTRLIPGSEGTLGVVAAARLRLVRRPTSRCAAILAFGSLADATSAVTALRRELPTLEAADFFLRPGLELVREKFGSPALFERTHEAFLVLSCASDTDPTGELAAAVATLGAVEDAVVGGSPAQHERLWSYRELHNEAINRSGVPHKLDVALPPERVPSLLTDVDAWLSSERPAARGIYYGHLADGNVHVNVVGAAPDDDVIDETILKMVAASGGSISAEHGVGQAKNRWLALTRSPEEISKMRAIKAALDPHGILNPGKLLPPSASTDT